MPPTSEDRNLVLALVRAGTSRQEVVSQLQTRGMDPEAATALYHKAVLRVDAEQRGGAGGAADDGGGDSMMGWVIFILIFVVGNGILYATTGIFFIPIPRR